jgi:two-component system, chemotaxis family, chemotaxis protein CheY
MDLSCIIVDDDEVTTELVSTYLEEIPSIAITTFSDPTEALKHIKKNKTHILILDIVMPGMDGIELLEKAKEVDPLTHVIMMTSNSTLGRVIQSLGYGALDFILKPFSGPSDMRDVVQLSVQRWERWFRVLKDTAKRTLLERQEDSADADDSGDGDIE